MPVWDPRGGGNVHIDQALTNVSVGFPSQDLAGEVLYPSVPVRKQSDLYYIFGREAWQLDPSGDYRAPATVANEIPGMKVSTTPYFAREHALQIAVSDEERENADSPFSPDRDGADLVTSKVMLQREVLIRDQAVTAANYPADHVVTLAGTTQWNDYANSDPIKNIKDGVRKVHSKIFTVLNTAIIPWEVMTQLEDHPDFIERIKYSERGILTPQIIASVLGIQRVVVPGTGWDSANPGQSSSYGYLWGKDVILAYVPQRPGLRIPAYGYEFTWSFGGRVQIVDRWREDPRASDLIRFRRRYDLKQVTLDANGKATAGFVIKSAVA